ncbi:hypothetical protein EVAR_67793_1 [Eumeta japonica]|uniref:Uncharacterized protein n=1 Tax=Eumeta variegata TaxID=151549 RepID=A0A4C1ZZG7_EUMVA|nr:hypothetical protein EVAR_67793_1 [Eumeta japonica]
MKLVLKDKLSEVAHADVRHHEVTSTTCPPENTNEQLSSYATENKRVHGESALAHRAAPLRGRGGRRPTRR